MTVKKIIANFEVSSEITEEFIGALEGLGCDIISKIVDPGADGKDYIFVTGYPLAIDALKHADLTDFGIRAV